MAKKITALVRLQIPVDEQQRVPTAARALGRWGINVTAFSNAFHALRRQDHRHVVPVIVTVYEDISFSLAIEPARVGGCREPAVAV